MQTLEQKRLLPVVLSVMSGLVSLCPVPGSAVRGDAGRHRITGQGRATAALQYLNMAPCSPHSGLTSPGKQTERQMRASWRAATAKASIIRNLIENLNLKTIEWVLDSFVVQIVLLQGTVTEQKRGRKLQMVA